jgi:hypothetical protein
MLFFSITFRDYLFYFVSLFEQTGQISRGIVRKRWIVVPRPIAAGLKNEASSGLRFPPAAKTKPLAYFSGFT